MDTTQNMDVLDSEESPIGMIWLRTRELVEEPRSVVTEIMLDHMLLMSSCNTASEEALSRRALELHPGEALRVLVGGLGLGHTVKVLLDSKPVARVEVVEFLPVVIGWLERGLVPLAAKLGSDPRFSVRQGDVYGELAGTPTQKYDLALIDVDHSPDEALGDESAAFYSEAGLQRAKQHLAPGGILGVWSYSESPHFEATLRRCFRDVQVEGVTFYNRLTTEEETNVLFFGRD